MSDVVSLQLPKNTLKWFEKLSLIHGSKKVEEFLVEMLMRELGAWLSDEDGEVLDEICMTEILEDGIIDTLTRYDVTLSWAEYFHKIYGRKKMQAERSATSQPEGSSASIRSQGA